MTVCVLYQASESLIERVKQVNILLGLTDTFYMSESDIPEANKPRAFITVDEDLAIKIVSGEKKIPTDFGIKVKASEASEAFEASNFNLHNRITEYIKHDPEDILAQAYIKKYRITEYNTVCIVWDQKHKSDVDPVYMANALNHICQNYKIEKKDINIVVFLINPNGMSLQLSGKEINIVSGLPEIQIFNVVTQCKKHILLGNVIDYICAVLTPNVCCVYPDPWKIEDPTFKLNQNWHAIKYKWSSTKYFDRIYYINLEHRTDRKAHMEKQLDKFNLSAIRVQAYDGKNIKWDKKYGLLCKYWNANALACCMSHCQALIDAQLKGYEKVLILEDDANLDDNFLKVLEQAWSDLPDNWHMLYLGANHGKPELETFPTQAVGDHLYRLNGSLCAHAVIINKVCYQNFINYLMEPYGPIDVYYSVYQRTFPCYCCNPGLAEQIPSHSNILDTYVDYRSKVNFLDLRK